MVTGSARKGSSTSDRFRKWLRAIADNRWLYLLILPAVVYLIIFNYLPMYGIQIAFKNYKAVRGIAGSEWVGFKHFQTFFSAYYFGRLITNTLLLNVLGLIFSFPIPVCLAVIINNVRSQRLKKFTQTAIYVPHFISTVVLAGILYIFLSPTNGIVNHMIAALGGKPIYFMNEASFWPMRGWTGNLRDSTADWKLRAWYCAAQWKSEPVLKLAVYDESEPWDGARGAWGFPQMRAHWRYDCFEKMLHVAAMTNCDTVKLYQNSQTVRVGRLEDFPDGMIHFWLPFIPGILRAEGWRGGMKVAEDILYSDHTAQNLLASLDRSALPADGRSVAMIDLSLEDAHGCRYMLEDRKVRVHTTGAPVRVLMDNGDAWSTEPFEKRESRFDHGHLLVLLQAGTQPGIVEIFLEIEGFGTRDFRLTLE